MNSVRRNGAARGAALHRSALMLCACLGAIHVEGIAQAVSSTTPARADTPVEQRLRDELRLVMADLIQNGAFGDTDPGRIAMEVQTPAQNVGNLGVLVDSARDSRDGLRVLGVTPGGSAERLGLRAGDELLSVNGTSLAAAGGTAKALKTAVDQLPDGSPLSFQIRRDGRPLSFSGSVSRIHVPAMHLSIGAGTAVAANAPGAAGVVAASAAAAARADTTIAGSGCGRVSDFDVAPRQEQLHSARIMSIDGVSAGPSGSQSFRVSAGTHTLKIAERIESRYLGFNDALRNSGLDSRRYKSLTVDVPTDTTVLVAARLNDDKRNDWKDGAYWDPIAWKQITESCR